MLGMTLEQWFSRKEILIDNQKRDHLQRNAQYLQHIRRFKLYLRQVSLHFEDTGIQLDFYALFRPKEITKIKTAFIMYAPTNNTTQAEAKSPRISARCCWLVVKLINGGVYQTLLFKGPNRFPGNTRHEKIHIYYI